MAKYEIPGFSGGEVSPEIYGRTDLGIYRMSCKTLKNAFGLPSGPAVKRPGTLHLAPSSGGILIPFKISEASYVVVSLEPDRARIIYGPGDYLDVTANYPYGAVDRRLVDYVQIGEKLYLVHAGVKPKSLERTPGSPNDTWAFSDISFNVTPNSFPDFGGSAGDYPSLIEIYESRLILAATNNSPGTIWGSCVGLYETFTVQAPIVPSDAWAVTPQPAKKAKILWLAAEDAFCFGTEEGPWRVGGEENILEATALAWWPKKQGGAGGFPVKPIIAENSVIYAQRGGRRLRSFVYSDAVNKWKSEDLNAASSHIFGLDGLSIGSSALAFQQDPESIIWAVGSGGGLYSLLISDVFASAGWSRHDLGGVVGSVIAVPSALGEDRVVVSVNRGGVNSIEEFSPFYGQGTVYVDDAVAVYAERLHGTTGITVDDTVDIGKCTVHSAGHILQDGELVRVLIPDLPGLEAEVYQVGERTANDFVLYYRAGNTWADMSQYETTTADGVIIPVVNAVTGLHYPDGTIVKLVIDGAYAGDAEVESGAVSAPIYGQALIVGRGYEMEVEPLEIPDFSRIKRTVNIFLRVYDSYGCKIGPRRDRMDEVRFEEGVHMDEPAPGVTDILKVPFPAGPDYRGTIFIKSDTPTPLKVTAVLAEFEVS